MNFIHKHFILILIIVFVCFVLSAVSAILEAYLDTRKRPKEEMLWCNKHGYFRKKHALPMFPHMEHETLVCPQCYKESVYDNVQVKG